MTREPKLHVYKFGIDLKEDDVNKCGVLLLIQYNTTIFLIHKILNALADYELLFSVDISDEGHNIEKTQRTLSLKIHKSSFK